MGYNRDTPGATESVSVSQRKMRVNSIVVDQIFNQEHYAFSDEEDFRGKHRKLTLPNQSTPTTLADEIALYSRDDGGDQVVSILYPSSADESNILFTGDLGNITRIGSLIVGASCKFDNRGNLIKGFNISNIERTTETSGTTIVRVNSQFKINFTNTLPNNDYFISLSSVGEDALGSLNLIFIKPNATYGDSVDPDFIRLTSNFSVGSQLVKTIYNLRIWLVA